MQFQDYIRNKGLLKDEDYKKIMNNVLADQHTTFFKELKKSGVMDENTAIISACEFFGCIRLPQKAFETEVDFACTTDFDTIENCMANKNFFIKTSTNEVFLVVSDPSEGVVIDKAASLMGRPTTNVLLTDEEYNIFEIYQLKPFYHKMKADEFSNAVNRNTADRINFDFGSGEISKFCNYLIESCLERRASDLHIVSLNDGNALVSLRVDGEPQKYTTFKGSIMENLKNYLCTECNVNGRDAISAASVDGQFDYKYNGRNIDIRVSIMTIKTGYKMTLRFLERKVRTIQQLGLSEHNYEAYTHLIHMTHGLIIFCGPTGSGKTTTLYAALNELNNSGHFIITAEDPVEIDMPGVAQIEIKGGKFADIIGPMLRADPDDIVIGEIRNEDAANECIRAANTGHLVFSTVHANNALSVIPRLTKLGVGDYILGDALSGIIANRLIRCVCPHCREEYLLPKDHEWRKRYNLNKDPDNPQEIKLYKGKGCEFCSGTGYLGRTSIMEIVTVTPKLRDAIQDGEHRAAMEAILKENGQRTMIDEGIDKALAGITTFSELDKFSYDV